ncbi:MAG: pyridoxamine 5'-phosphate oxidase family protein [Chitinophagaceae bacterium]|nr:pyridoxamine 5'-phosphate oxidase family protein [Chitinophagaceae bacterium]
MEKNLQSAQAVKKLQTLISDVRTCMMVTSGKSGRHSGRPMAVIDVDDHANLWFFASNKSAKVKDIEEDTQVQLVFANPQKDIFIDVYGRASIETDRRYITEKWNPLVKAWFPDGVDDPALCLIKIKADEAHYWDTDATKVGAMVKMALSAVTGKKLEEGVHGELHF